MTIYIIRHGQTLWNKDLRWQGCTDVELNETGLAQAADVAMRLRGCNITTIYSSPLKRARATAEAIGEILRLQPFFRDDLKEVALGPWEGLSFAQVRERYAEKFRVWETDAKADVGMGIESYSRLCDRAVAAVRDICKGHRRDETVALVTHGAWIRAFMLYVLNIPLDKRLCFDLDNTGVSIVRYDAENARFRVSVLNEHPHARGGNPTRSFVGRGGATGMIKIRDAVEDDYIVIQRLNRDALGYDYDIQKTKVRLKYVLEARRDRVFVAEADGQAVGYAHAEDYECIHSDPVKNIIAIAVDENYRGLGIGRELLAAVEGWARETGAAGIRLTSGYDRTAAHKFYLACGYTDRKDCKNFIKFLKLL